jgi:hypothetical protein
LCIRVNDAARFPSLPQNPTLVPPQDYKTGQPGYQKSHRNRNDPELCATWGAEYRSGDVRTQMQRKFVDPEHARKQQIWQSAEKRKVFTQKLLVVDLRRPMPRRGTNSESQMKSQ